MRNTVSSIKTLDELGRIALPLEARTALGFVEKEQLEVLTDSENGQVILRRLARRCLKCGATESLSELTPNHALCRSCIAALR